jgi:hypothetical protein
MTTTSFASSNPYHVAHFTLSIGPSREDRSVEYPPHIREIDPMNTEVYAPLFLVPFERPNASKQWFDLIHDLFRFRHDLYIQLYMQSQSWGLRG